MKLDPDYPPLGTTYYNQSGPYDSNYVGYYEQMWAAQSDYDNYVYNNHVANLNIGHAAPMTPERQQRMYEQQGPPPGFNGDFYSQGEPSNYSESVYSNEELRYRATPACSEGDMGHADSGVENDGKWSPEAHVNKPPLPPQPLMMASPASHEATPHSQIAQELGLLPIKPDIVYPQSCIFCIVNCPHPTAEDIGTLNDGTWFNKLSPEHFAQVLAFINPPVYAHAPSQYYQQMPPPPQPMMPAQPLSPQSTPVEPNHPV